MRGREPDIELVYTLPDPWTRKLFLALCRRYGLKPYRKYRQRYSTIQVMAPETFAGGRLKLRDYSAAGIEEAVETGATSPRLHLVWALGINAARWR